MASTTTNDGGLQQKVNKGSDSSVHYFSNKVWEESDIIQQQNQAQI